MISQLLNVQRHPKHLHGTITVIRTISTGNKLLLPRTLYNELGVSEKATPEAIKEARNRLAKKYHPDTQRGAKDKDACTERLVSINNAYEVLSDPEARKVYDIKIAANPYKDEKSASEYMRRQKYQSEWERSLAYHNLRFKDDWENPFKKANIIGFCCLVIPVYIAVRKVEAMKANNPLMTDKMWNLLTQEQKERYLDPNKSRRYTRSIDMMMPFRVAEIEAEERLVELLHPEVPYGPTIMPLRGMKENFKPLRQRPPPNGAETNEEKTPTNKLDVEKLIVKPHDTNVLPSQKASNVRTPNVPPKHKRSDEQIMAKKG